MIYLQRTAKRVLSGHRRVLARVVFQLVLEPVPRIFALGIKRVRDLSRVATPRKEAFNLFSQASNHLLRGHFGIEPEFRICWRLGDYIWRRLRRNTKGGRNVRVIDCCRYKSGTIGKFQRSRYCFATSFSQRWIWNRQIVKGVQRYGIDCGGR